MSTFAGHDAPDRPTEAARRLRVVVTGGGTHEPIDDVRHLANVASGRLPAAIANEWLARGAEVHYLHGPGAALPGHATLEVDVTGLGEDEIAATIQAFTAYAENLRERLLPGWLTLCPVQTAAEVTARLRELVTAVQPDVVVCAMAVADFAPEPVAGKLQSRQDSLGTPGNGADPGQDGLTLHLRPTAKAIDGVKQAAPGCRLLGFKLLSGAPEAELCAAAAHLARRSGADWVFANDVVDYRNGHRRGLLVAPDGAVLERLDGGKGQDGLHALAEALVAAVTART